MKAKEILQTLDSYSEDFDFPVLDNYNFDLAQCRLSVFKDEENWLIVFEIVGVDKNQNIANDLYVYGKDAEEQGFIISLDDIVTLADNRELFDDDDQFLVNPFHLDLIVNKETVVLESQAGDYAQLGIEPESFNPTKLARFLSAHCKEKFWLSTSDMFQEIDAVPSLTLFYQTEGWEHIDEEKPSENHFFQSLANAIELNDKNVIHEENPNTHWSNWTWSDFEKQDEE
ncbi:hypothetical protein RRU94_22195 [Domibacillus sp. DTU_2020_1001157_1_SI_ALB_TIR_016]|uniref:DUF7003 family protein n=1 Tax=Domibacillus sp. DTU_2020_1001157_1_SI_ALB_TIR_016 TaxID=3077789 RepID=UPI0028F0A66B|nr:hypothetical protein [Domibacillus sp. DTU_2020_1001157_1_SI_ALB_TIR_016]WNS80196.1 hypothetical protein RRU94_22195 [Domibacillus sp. DTU_2020_1001157_1_SI_ALB_TIR_016]